MKKHIFFGVLLLTFLAEAAALILFFCSRAPYPQDTVAVNEVRQTVQNDWHCLSSHQNRTLLDYVVLGLDGAVLYRTKRGLNETINAAVGHKDTILTVESDRKIAGHIIIPNNDADIFQSQKRAALFAVTAAMCFQCAVLAAYFLYLHIIVIKPFEKLKNFAQRVAGGNLDIPLEMDRQNLFGAFTESFDIMRSELKKARMAEARANADKKELVAKLSHDIKTPVASIQAAAEVGAALAADGKTRANYSQIMQKAVQINTLITNLFSATLEGLQELSVQASALKSKDRKSVG